MPASRRWPRLVEKRRPQKMPMGEKILSPKQTARPRPTRQRLRRLPETMTSQKQQTRQTWEKRMTTTSQRRMRNNPPLNSKLHRGKNMDWVGPWGGTLAELVSEVDKKDEEERHAKKSRPGYTPSRCSTHDKEKKSPEPQAKNNQLVPPEKEKCHSSTPP